MPRRTFSGRKLAEDAQRLAGADQVAPPESRPTLMDAVRQFTGFIEARAKARWTSTAIAAALTAAGYPIDAATLRSYRKRLRDERDQSITPEPVVATPDQTPPAPPPPPAAVRRPDMSTFAPPAPRPPSSGPPTSRNPRFALDDTDLPPDRA